jgi:hypothetical protein
MQRVFAITDVAVLAAACGDRVDNNTVNINIGGDAGSDTAVGFDTAPADVEAEVIAP